MDMQDLEDIAEINEMLQGVAEQSCKKGISTFAEDLRGHIEKSQVDFPGKSLTAHQILTFINHVEEAALNSVVITAVYCEELVDEEVPNGKPH